MRIIRFCEHCHKRTWHIEDINSRICLRCSRHQHLGNVQLGNFNVKVPKYKPYTHI